MGLFRRKDKAAQQGEDLSVLLMQGEDMIGQLAQAHASWGLGTADHWGLDQTTGLITWTFPDKTATAPAQILGSYSPSGGTWMWAWANESILPAMSRDSLAVRTWAEANGHDAFTIPRPDADAEQAASLVAVAVRVTKATGYYRAPGERSTTVITFGPVTLTAADGTTSTFRIQVGD